MITTNLNAMNEHHVGYGNADDVCLLCAYEYALKTKGTLTQADRALRGQFEGKKMLRMPLSGIRATICMDHIHRIADANPADVEEEEKGTEDNAE